MKRMIRIPVLVASLCVVSLGALASNVALAAPTQTPAPASTPMTMRSQHAPDGLLDTSLKTLNLTADQRSQIEALKASIVPLHNATKAARQGLLESLAAEVQLGTVDPNTLQAKMDGIANAADAERAQERTAIEKLHTILDKSQRDTLVNDLTGKLAGWHPSDPKPSNELRRMARELRLTKVQRKQIGAILSDEAKTEPMPTMRQAKANERKIIEAFRADNFSIDKVVPNDAKTKAMTRVTNFVQTVSKVEPLLSVQQRGVAATHLHDRAGNGTMIL
jgi:Spy/CpxP family protein refolding chaperone